MLDIIVFAALAAFVIFKLKRLLGEEYSETSKNVKDIEASVSDAQNSKKYSALLAQKGKQNQPLVIEESVITEEIARHFGEISPEISAKISQLYKIVPGFGCEAFKYGAIATFEAILEAYSAANITEILATSKPNVAKNFISIIDQHRAEGVMEKIHVAKVNTIKILNIEIDQADLHVSLQFDSWQITYNLDATGVLVSGSKSQQHRALETWVFTRSKASLTPEWFVEDIKIESVS